MPDRAAPEEPAVVAVTTAVVERPIIAVALLLRQVVDLLLIILVAIVFAEGVRPLANRLVDRGLPRPAAIAVVYVGLIGMLALLITLLVQPIVDEATSLAHNFPSYQADIESTVASWQRSLNLGGSGTPNLGSTLAGGLDTAK